MTTFSIKTTPSFFAFLILCGILMASNPAQATLNGNQLSELSPMAVQAAGNVTIDADETLGPNAYVTFNDLAPEENLQWTYQISDNGNYVTASAQNGAPSLPANTDLALVTFVDPDTGFNQTVLVKTDGGSIMIVLPDM